MDISTETKEFDIWFLSNKYHYAKLRLYLFPPAGSDVSIFYKWEEQLPTDVEVCKLKLPGRGMRYNDPFESNCQSLAHKIADIIDSNTDIPFVIFGHSMGALIAYETAAALQEKGNKLLKQISVSALKAPDSVSNDGCFEDENNHKLYMQKLDDDKLQNKLIEMGGIPSAILDEPTFIKFLLPIFRNDLYLCDTYHLKKKVVLDIPIDVYGGKSDHIACADDLEKWKNFSSKKVRVLLFPGNHFYFESSKGMFMFDFSRRIEKIMENLS